MQFVFPCKLLVTISYLHIYSGYLGVTSGKLIAATGYFWLHLVTSRYFWFLVLLTANTSIILQSEIVLVADEKESHCHA